MVRVEAKEKGEPSSLNLPWNGKRERDVSGPQCSLKSIIAKRPRAVDFRDRGSPTSNLRHVETRYKPRQPRWVGCEQLENLAPNMETVAGLRSRTASLIPVRLMA